MDGRQRMFLFGGGGVGLALAFLGYGLPTMGVSSVSTGLLFTALALAVLALVWCDALYQVWKRTPWRLTAPVVFRNPRQTTGVREFGSGPTRAGVRKQLAAIGSGATDELGAPTPPPVDLEQGRRKRLREDLTVANEEFHVWELLNLGTDPKPLVVNRTFTDCVIKGPAMVTFIGHCNLDRCLLGEGNLESVLHEMTNPGEKQGLIGFFNCTFTRCKFLGIGYFGDKLLLDKLRTGTTIL